MAGILGIPMTARWTAGLACAGTILLAACGGTVAPAASTSAPAPASAAASVAASAAAAKPAASASPAGSASVATKPSTAASAAAKPPASGPAGASASAKPAGSAAAAPASVPAGSAQHGQEVFTKVGCYQCHAYQGQGGSGTGPKLAPNPLPFVAFQVQVRTPRQDMPKYTQQFLSDQDLGGWCVLWRGEG